MYLFNSSIQKEHTFFGVSFFLCTESEYNENSDNALNEIVNDDGEQVRIGRFRAVFGRRHSNDKWIGTLYTGVHGDDWYPDMAAEIETSLQELLESHGIRASGLRAQPYDPSRRDLLFDVDDDTAMSLFYHLQFQE